MVDFGQSSGSRVTRIPALTKGLDNLLDIRFYFNVSPKLRAEIRQELKKLQNMELLGDGGYSRREIHVYPIQPRYSVVDKVDDSTLGTYETGSRTLTSEEVAQL